MSDYFVYGDPVKTKRPLISEDGRAILSGTPGRVNRVSDLFNPATNLYEGHYTVMLPIGGETVWVECWHSELVLDSTRERQSPLAVEPS